MSVIADNHIIKISPCLLKLTGTMTVNVCKCVKNIVIAKQVNDSDFVTVVSTSNNYSCGC